MNYLKLQLISCCLVFFFSCNNTKNVQEKEDSTTNSSAENPRVIGTVHLSDDSCPVYLETEVAPNEMKTMYPVNLDEKFKREGVRLKFTYSLSRAMSPAGCKVDFVVSLNDVSAIR